MFRKSLIAVVFLILVLAFIAKIILPSKAEEFTNFSGYEIPSDVRNLRYSTSGYDFFADHDGTFSFEASEASLREIAAEKFRGEFSWTESENDRIFSLKCEPRYDRSVEGVIDLNQKTLRIEYSTWRANIQSYPG